MLNVIRAKMMARPILRPIPCLRASRRIESSLAGKAVPARSRAMTYLVIPSGTGARGAAVGLRAASAGGGDGSAPSNLRLSSQSRRILRLIAVRSPESARIESRKSRRERMSSARSAGTSVLAAAGCSFSAAGGCGPAGSGTKRLAATA